MTLKPGCIPAVIYYVRRDGHITLAPFTDAPTPEGCRKEYADTLKDVDSLCAKLCAQEHAAAEKEMSADAAFREPREKAIRDRLYSRMTAGTTSEYEKEFIRLYMQLRDERKRETYRQRFLEAQWYLYAREHNLGDRDASKEEVNLDKVNF